MSKNETSKECNLIHCFDGQRREREKSTEGIKKRKEGHEGRKYGRIPELISIVCFQ
jgi:hypothetical protein